MLSKSKSKNKKKATPAVDGIVGRYIKKESPALPPRSGSSVLEQQTVTSVLVC